MNYQFELGQLLGKVNAGTGYLSAMADKLPSKMRKHYDAMYMELDQIERNIIWTKTLIDARLQILKIFPSCSITIDELRNKIERLDEDEIYNLEVTFEGVKKTIRLDWY